MDTIALILAGGKGSRLDLLSQKRSKPAVPFAGKYRIIDFTLSNCTQSGIYDIGILTQYLPFSLNEHIGSGKPWDLDRRDTGVTLLQPHTYWYEGTADAVLKNISYVKRRNAKYVLILSGDHVYKMDYRLMIEEHKKNNAQLTIATIPVPPEETDRFGMMDVDDKMKIVDFEEKPKETSLTLASMGIYLFNTETLLEVLEEVKEVDLDFGKHIIPYLIKEKNADVYAYRFDGYWRDVGTYDSYMETSLELISHNLDLNLYDEKWKIHTKSEERPPVKIGENAKITNSLLSNGCIIEGEVINSVLSPGVYVGKNTIIRNSVILNDSRILNGCVIENVIFDKKVKVGNNVKIGIGDNIPNTERPDLISSGITVLEKHVEVPDGVEIGKNCRVFVTYDFSDKKINSGSTLK